MIFQLRVDLLSFLTSGFVCLRNLKGNIPSNGPGIFYQRRNGDILGLPFQLRNISPVDLHILSDLLLSHSGGFSCRPKSLADFQLFNPLWLFLKDGGKGDPRLLR